MYSWRAGYKINLGYENIIKERSIICAAWKREGEKTVHSLHWDKRKDDRDLLVALTEALNKSDEIVAHFGDSFDLPWVRTRCLFHGLVFPDYKTTDTLKWARRKFYFNSNKLDYLAKFLGVGSKLRTEDGLWRRVMDGNKQSLATMIKYNQHDVFLLEGVWKKLSVVMAPKSHAGIISGEEKWSCPRCASRQVKISKTRVTAAGTRQYQMQCLEDGGYFTISANSHLRYLHEKR